MKNFVLLLALLVCTMGFSSCENDIDDLIETKQDLNSEETIVAELQSFHFLAKNNPKALVLDIECSIIGDSIIECHIPHIVENKMLIPSFKVIGGKLTINNTEVISDETEIDCTNPLNIKITGLNYSHTYKLRVKSFTGLPIVFLETENKNNITSKIYYIKGNFRIVEDNKTWGGAWNGVKRSIEIKGRGNSTWDMPKKPYKIKFEKKTSLLRIPPDKEWLLLANYTDKTSLRNEIGFEMGRISNLNYTPRTHFVEVILNDVYIGTYQLAENLKISKTRVNVGDDGYLLEISARANINDISFRVSHIEHPINVKEPNMEVNSEAYNYVVKYLQEADSVLFSENFTDVQKGYAKYLDVQSFVDWYLINEIAKNTDACFFASCYMNLTRDGKLKMGPLWDFDIAFGNTNYNGCDNPEEFYIKSVAWYTRLFQDPNFVEKVKARFAFFYENREKIYAKINDNANYLKYAIVENNNKWGTLYAYTWPNNMIWGSYENEVQSMKIWLEKRFQWLNEQFSSM